MVQGGGFEPPKLARQIYSLIPLATREPLRKQPDIVRFASLNVNRDERTLTIRLTTQIGFDATACTVTLPPARNRANSLQNGAGERSRTPDRLITSQLLYQLSYTSFDNPKPAAGNTLP